jgi:murein L,D-transpeptidase YafK
MSFGRIIPVRTMLCAAVLMLSACQEDFAHRAQAPIPPETVALMAQVGSDPQSPMLIRSYKKEAELEIWKMRSDGRYAHLKTFPMCRWSGQLGPKTREGDRQVPEGFYAISPGQMNPNSNYYLSFNVGYPNQLDRALGHTGGSIMVHGACSSAGCFSMTDKQIAEIYAIARSAFEGGQRNIQMQSYPFRMTPENMAKHRLDANISFWKQLKQGNDHFEVTKQEPRVAFCGYKYVFDATPVDGENMDVGVSCPSLKTNPDIARAVSEKEEKDNAKIAELERSGLSPVRIVYQDGGQHPSFASRVADVSRPEAIEPPVEIKLEDKSRQTTKPLDPQITQSASVVSPATARMAAERHALETQTPLVRALASDPRRDMSAVAHEVEAVAQVPKKKIKRSAAPASIVKK